MIKVHQGGIFSRGILSNRSAVRLAHLASETMDRAGDLLGTPAYFDAVQEAQRLVNASLAASGREWREWQEYRRKHRLPRTKTWRR